MTIRGNLWFHQYEQVGGDAVDFVRRFYNLDYREAVLTLTSMGVGMIREPVEPFTQKPLQIPAKYENMRRVYGYLLQRRGIDKEVLDTFAYRGLVYECDRYHNAVFVGIDKEKEIRHIHKRSTAAQGGFKGNAPGSEPEYSFHWHGGGDVLYLFEAPIDMLSFISMFKHCWKSQSYAASCGVSDKVLWQMLKDGPHIKKVYICFDNDKPGQQAAQRISREMTEKNIWHEIYPPENKDWNEDLLKWRKGQV